MQWLKSTTNIMARQPKQEEQVIIGKGSHTGRYWLTGKELLYLNNTYTQ